MNNYRILFDIKNIIITVRYHETVKYKALLNSLKDLLTIYIPKDAQIVLDFSKVKFLKVAYHQISNFRDGLKVLFPKKKVGKISIINCPDNSYASVFCASTPTIESEFIGRDLRCFESHNKSEAYH